eukprot:3102928-Rhodomonas_salina.1
MNSSSSTATTMLIRNVPPTWYKHTRFQYPKPRCGTMVPVFSTTKPSFSVASTVYSSFSTDTFVPVPHTRRQYRTSCSKHLTKKAATWKGASPYASSVPDIA